MLQKTLISALYALSGLRKQSAQAGTAEGVRAGLPARIEARRGETGRLFGLARCAARKPGPERSAGEHPAPSNGFLVCPLADVSFSAASLHVGAQQLPNLGSIFNAVNCDARVGTIGRLYLDNAKTNKPQKEGAFLGKVFHPVKLKLVNFLVLNAVISEQALCR